MDNQLLAPLDFLYHWATETPDATAIHLNAKDYTYKEFLTRCMARADYLKERGAGRGTICAVYSDNEKDFFFTLFGLWMAGAICVPMNISQKQDKLELMEKTVQPAVGFFSQDFNIAYERPFPIYPLGDGDKDPDTASPVRSRDMAIIMFTSGTSGVPKAVPMSHNAIGRNAHCTAVRIGVNASDRLLINTPAYTTSSIIHVLTMLSQGATTIIDRRFYFGSSIIEQIEEHRCTGFGGVPVHFSRLLAALSESKAPASLKFLMNSGDHLPVAILTELLKIIKDLRFYCAYGLTEVGGRLCILPPEMIPQKSGSVGIPLDGMVLTIRNPNGEDADPGEIGQVFVQGPNLMTGYLNNHTANAKSMTEHGFATGDYGMIDADGYLFLKGRKDDIFKVGGEKVSLKMIEEAVIGLNYFSECMVVMAYDEHIGNIPCLYYVDPKEGYHRKQMLSKLRKILPPTHIPARFTQIDQIPRTSSGKPIRKAMTGDS